MQLKEKYYTWLNNKCNDVVSQYDNLSNSY